MTALAIYLIAKLAAIVCVVSAAWLANKGVAGWGWFLFAAVILALPAVKVAA